MPKHIKKYKKRKKPIRFNPDNKKTNLWNKELSVPQQIIFYIVFALFVILIIGIIAYFIGEARLNAQGYETSDLVVENYFKGIDETNESLLRNCYSLYTKNNEKDFQQQVSNAKTLGPKIQIKENTCEIKTAPFDTTDIINNLRNPYITNANIINVSFKETKNTDYITAEQTCTYKLITYEFQTKWYLYAVEETSEKTTSASHKNGKSIEIMTQADINLCDTQRVGNKDIGYILIGTDWTEQSASQNDNLENLKSYVSSDKNAVITLGITSNHTIDDLTTIVINSLLENNPDIQKSDIFKTDTTFCEYSAEQIFYVSNNNVHSMTWLFKTDESDIVHVISFDYTANNTNFSQYVNTFTMT